MKLDSFRVQNYRSILDSGWVELTDILTIVGKNESGKTSLLKALWKLKPFRPDPYSLEREWPRGRRKERSLAAPVITAKFSFSPMEVATLSDVDVSCEGLTGVEITKSYDGNYLLSYSPHSVASKRNGASANRLLTGTVEKALSKVEPSVRAAATALVGGFTERLVSAELQTVPTVLAEIKTQLAAQSEQLGDAATVQALSAGCDTVASRLNESPWDVSWLLIKKWIPTFVYMDDFLAFKGTAFLDQVKQRKDANQLRDDDRTIITIMEMAGLDLDQEVQKGGQADREQRMLDMNDASQTGVAPSARTDYCAAKGVRNEVKKRGVSARISSANGGVSPSWTQAQRIGPGVWLPRNQHQCVGSSSQSR